MRSIGGWVALAIPFALLAGPAAASVGGPLTVKVLGWDAATARIYVEQVGHDESGERNCTFYYDLRSGEPTRAQVVPASRHAFPPDTVGMARGRLELQRTLVRVWPLARDDKGKPASPAGTTILDRRWVEEQGHRLEQFQIAVRGLEGAGAQDTIRVTTYQDPRVRVVARYRVPGRDERLVVLSYRGDHFEGVDEVQQCVVLRTAQGGMQRLDSDRGVLK